MCLVPHHILSMLVESKGYGLCVIPKYEYIYSNLKFNSVYLKVDHVLLRDSTVFFHSSQRHKQYKTTNEQDAGCHLKRLPVRAQFHRAA